MESHISFSNEKTGQRKATGTVRDKAEVSPRGGGKSPLCTVAAPAADLPQVPGTQGGPRESLQSLREVGPLLTLPMRGAGRAHERGSDLKTLAGGRQVLAALWRRRALAR